MISDLFGWVATILFSYELIPQIRKTIKTKTVRGVSPWVAIIYLVANVIALIYAIFIKQNPLIVKYTIAIPVAIFSLIIYSIYCRKEIDDSSIT